VTPYYEDPLVTLYHGDCREILPDLRGIDLVLTDPPYGIAYQHGARKGGVLYGSDGVTIVGDDRPFDPSHVLKAATRLILWGANHYADKLPASRGWLVWDKRGPDGPVNDQSDVELAWTNFLATARTFHRRWWGGIRGGREQAEGRYHMNQKPVALLQWCLSWVDPAPSLVCDPYVGSGSTLVACKDLGIKAIGIEIEERYCEIAAQRCAQEVLPLGAA